MSYEFITNLLIFLIIAIYLTLFKYTKINFNVLHLLLILIFPIGIGYQAWDEANGSRISYYFWLSFIALIAGYFLSAAMSVGVLHSSARSIKYSTDKMLAAIIVLVSAYHIYALGIPILRSDVEVARFSFGDSGFMGIPSRIFLIVFPIFAIYTLQKYLSTRSKESYKIMAFTWASYLILQIASGFKGALLVMIIIAAFSIISGKNRYYFRDILKFKYLIYILISALFAILVSFQYGSRKISNFESGMGYIYQRATKEAAEAGYIVFSEAKFKATRYVENDLYYFSDRYFGIESKKEIFPSDRIISSKISKTPLDDRYFIVSVTTGLASLLYSDFGIFITLFIFFIIGAMIRLSSTSASLYYKKGDFVASSILTYLIYNIYVVIVNGNPIYWVINTIIGCIIFIVILNFSNSAMRLRSKWL